MIEAGRSERTTSAGGVRGPEEDRGLPVRIEAGGRDDDERTTSAVGGVRIALRIGVRLPEDRGEGG